MRSEDLLIGNLAALDQAQGQRPALAALDPANTRAVEIGPADAASLSIEIRGGDAWVPLWGPNPVGEATRQIDAAGKPAHLFVIGGGVGHVLDAIESAGQTTKVLILEPDPGVAVLLLARRDWQPWFASGRLRLLTGPDYTGASSVARSVNGADASAILVNPALAEHRPEAVQRARAVAQRIQKEATANADARKQHAGRYLLQTLGNLPIIKRESDAAALQGAFAGRPAVMVAAGPSLDAALPVLAAYQDQVVIIASDTTLRPLLAAGIRPHLMVGVDPGEVNARHLSGVANTSGIWMAAEASLNAAAFPCFEGRTFLFKVSDHEPWPWLREASLDRGTVRAWGSVATSAFDLALRMKCDPIIFIGHDMAYSSDRPYCDNTVFHEEWRAYLADKPWGTIRHYEELMMKGQPLISVGDVNGAPVKTAARLVAFRDWIVEQTAATRDRTFINATGGGILQGGRITQMSIEVALATHAGAPIDVRSKLTALHRRGVKTAKALTAPSPDVIARWIEFTAGTVDESAIRTALFPLSHEEHEDHENHEKVPT
jgi:hypothetical protein